MVDLLTPSDQRAGAVPLGGSNRARIWTMVVACLGVSLVIASMVALNTALGDIAVATSAAQSQLTWIVDGYTVTLACLLLPAGAIGDRYGRRGALLAGLAIFAIASVVPTVFASPLPIIVARAVAGAGAAFIMPATLSLLTAAHHNDERMKAVGIWAGVAGCGAVIGMLGSGALLYFWPWQSIFWAFAAGAALIFVLACTVSSSRDPQAAPLDWPGAVLIGIAVAVFVFGVIQAPARGWSDPLICGSLGAGVVLAAIFGFVEVRCRHPLLDVRLFGKPDFATGAATITVFFMAMFGFFYAMMQYVQLVMGYSPIKTALAFSPLMLPMLTFSVLSQWYVPRLGLRLVVFTGLLLISAGFLWTRVLEIDSPYWDMVWPLLVISSGIGFCTAPTTSAIMAAVPDEKQGVASAVNDTTREVGAALGIALTGSILAARYGHLVASHLAAFPEPLRGPASHSLAQALEISRNLGAQGLQLTELSRSAFLQAMESSFLVLAAIIALAAVLIGLWAPGRDGQQLRLMRRLTARLAGESFDELGGPVGQHHDGGVRSTAGDGRQD
ncbi:major facilitator superfamily transporter [Mycobacterium xenopi RIVM700367]|uniref:MFS transporter n=1 Tax=Mycobacterium xenopi TaxID=1789 RepID=UPI00025AEA9E|nr:MFS transporter [Mycobacterium xenopi]EID08754.1 major facilitator superfamily transporter [Mycobacterium xenopi RIVM700367]